MRPPEFTGGNPLRPGSATALARSFNEAAGIHRRKRPRVILHPDRIGDASMRPPEFTGGNVVRRNSPAETIENTAKDAGGAIASMRPPEFTGGNHRRSRISRRRPRSLQ